eukprot:CAMPEP_0196769550 /NCGR_PEP_ID=MMETSP1104-20130614/605_1 /TAXON_ID=33652 /ORGANISM="Cafeteria sp., Strain Caron Lab Isolate" /LENGTH=925 /DNA_ID=CAMNT_0042139645 /DNA_START=107 /DNA_END=2884 /DNA_ORIENTATION=+
MMAERMEAKRAARAARASSARALAAAETHEAALAELGARVEAPLGPEAQVKRYAGEERFSEDLAVRCAFVVAATHAWTPRPGECLEAASQNPLRVIGVVERWYREFSEDGTSAKHQHTVRAYVGVDEAAGRIFVAFRGSNNGQQLVAQAKQSRRVPVPSERVPDPHETSTTTATDAPPQPHAMSYFYNAFRTLTERREPDTDGYVSLEDLVLAARMQYPEFRVLMVGHSLGGALAVLAAYFFTMPTHNHPILEDGEPLLRDPIVYTFGQPRVGDGAFFDEYYTRVTTTWRVVHSTDVVARIPPLSWSARRSKDDDFYHVGREVWYPHGMPSLAELQLFLMEQQHEKMGVQQPLAIRDPSIDRELRAPTVDGLTAERQAHERRLEHRREQAAGRGLGGGGGGGVAWSPLTASLMNHARTGMHRMYGSFVPGMHRLTGMGPATAAAAMAIAGGMGRGGGGGGGSSSSAGGGGGGGSTGDTTASATSSMRAQRSLERIDGSRNLHVPRPQIIEPTTDFTDKVGLAPRLRPGWPQAHPEEVQGAHDAIRMTEQDWVESRKPLWNDPTGRAGERPPVDPSALVLPEEMTADPHASIPPGARIEALPDSMVVEMSDEPGFGKAVEVHKQLLGQEWAYRICDRGDDPRCSVGGWTLIMNSGSLMTTHQNYYNVPLAGWCETVLALKRWWTDEDLPQSLTDEITKRPDWVRVTPDELALLKRNRRVSELGTLQKRQMEEMEARGREEVASGRLSPMVIRDRVLNAVTFATAPELRGEVTTALGIEDSSTTGRGGVLQMQSPNAKMSASRTDGESESDAGEDEDWLPVSSESDTEEDELGIHDTTPIAIAKPTPIRVHRDPNAGAVHEDEVDLETTPMDETADRFSTPDHTSSLGSRSVHTSASAFTPMDTTSGERLRGAVRFKSTSSTSSSRT